MADLRTELWQIRHQEQQRLAGLRIQRRTVYAIYGEAGHEQARHLDRFIQRSITIIEHCTERILDASQSTQHQAVQQGTPSTQG